MSEVVAREDRKVDYLYYNGENNGPQTQHSWLLLSDVRKFLSFKIHVAGKQAASPLLRLVIRRRRRMNELEEPSLGVATPAKWPARDGIWFLRNDPPALLVMPIVYSALIYGEVAVAWVSLVAASVPAANFFVYTALTLMAVWSHLKVMLTNPGCVPAGATPLVSSQAAAVEADPNALCRRCQGFKPVRAHHCRICQHCVVRMDHHCLWVNNCIGANNHKHFLLFLFYTFSVCLYSIGLSAYHFVVCDAPSDTSACQGYTMTGLRLNRGCLVLSIAGGFFTFSMIIQQFQIVTSGVGTIDRMQRRRRRVRISPLLCDTLDL